MSSKSFLIEINDRQILNSRIDKIKSKGELVLSVSQPNIQEHIVTFRNIPMDEIDQFSNQIFDIFHDYQLHEID